MLILASMSPARNALLAGAGVRFTASPATIDERAIQADELAKGADAPVIAVALAKAKALAVARANPGATVIGADQLLALGSELLHKPADRAAAAAQLARLRGMTHKLLAGVAIARSGEILWSHIQAAELVMRDFSDAERDWILGLEGEQILGSVGAYRLEGPSIQLFERIEGDYFTILGLPLLPLLAALRLHAPELLEGFT
ncbi:MAG: Maf family protein [Devosia sp.]